VARSLAGAIRRGAKPLLTVGAVAALLVAVAAGWLWVTTTPRFAANHIIVTGMTGSTRLDGSQVAKSAGLKPGTNLFALSLTRVEDALLANPWIEEVSAHRQLPDRLLVEVREKRPAALVLAGSPYLADAAGRPFKRARLDTGEADGLPVVTGIERRLFTDHPPAAHALVRYALGLVAAWGTTPGRPAIGEVHLDEDGATLFTWQGGVGVRLGRVVPGEGSRPGQLETRLRRFDEVWAALSEEERAAVRTVYLDGTTRPDRVTVRLARE
jgi:cell division protein FtsQ